MINSNFKRLSLALFCLILSVFAFTEPVFAQLKAEYMRNGEVYLYIGKDSAPHARGMWRLNDPEGIQLAGQYFPQILPNIGNSVLRDFTVDINRNVYTLSDPDQSTIGDNFMIKRQVLDSSGGITTLNADRGCHAYIHYDHRNKYTNIGVHGAATTIYRTGPADNSLRPVRNNWGGSWSYFKARQGQATTAPASPNDYLPKGYNSTLTLKYYPGKKWYIIPNGAWYSSWKHRKGCGWYYQVFADRVSGTQYDWRLISWQPKNIRASSYSSNPQGPFATTYDMVVKRATLAGCLDGCGGSSGSGGVEMGEMIFSAAFMPFADNAGNPKVRTYAYSRAVGSPNYDISASAGANSFTAIGNPVGIGSANDTEWIGVSMQNRNKDFLYYMGNSVFRRWLNNSSLDIKAVTVSNQWNQEGGIIFGFDASNNSIRRVRVDASENVVFETIILSEDILGNINADLKSQIDDIAADGFGNLFLSLTYPSSNPHFDVPKAFGWTNNRAVSFVLESTSEGKGYGKLHFPDVVYRKSVWCLSSVGRPPEEMGSVEIARRAYVKDLAMPTAGWDELSAIGPLPADIDPIIASWTSADAGSFVSYFQGSPINLKGAGSSKLAVINAPTPPQVLSLNNKKSYLDIIGPYPDRNPPIPVPDITNRSTNQDDPNFPRGSSSNLDLGKLYFYMVENYPIPEAPQDPNVDSDYDGDGRSGGFISTIVNTDPEIANPRIRYVWNTWLVRDQHGEPVIPPIPSNTTDSVSTYFTAFYAPIAGKYIITCKVEYDWYDYDQMAFGTTIDDWKANPVVIKESALPSAATLDASGNPKAEWATNRIKTIVADFFSDFNTTGHPNYDPAKYSTIMKSMTDNIVDGFDFYAMEPVVATGSVPELKNVFEIARIQRCNPGNANVPALDSHWEPKGSNINPSDGYHGLRAGSPYRWRIDIASQAIFFDELSNTPGLPSYSSNPNHTLYTYYNFLAQKLEDPKQPDYYVGGNKDFRFNRTGEDIKWQANSQVTINAYIEYPMPDKNGNVTYIRYDVPNTDVKIETTNLPTGKAKFAYVTLPGDALPPTDPFVATLSIEISRGFNYDMYLYGKDGNLMMSRPIPLPKFLTVTGQASIMVIDTETPKIVFNRTSPNQIYGNTGEDVLPGINSNPSHLELTIMDNNPWEGLPVASHHKYKITNVKDNKTVTANLEKAGASAHNLKPVFNNATRFVEISYETALINAKRNITLSQSDYAPGWGRKESDLLTYLSKSETLKGLDSPAISYVADANERIFTSSFHFKQPIDKLGPAATSMRLPINYANNTPGYRPYKFFIEAMDSSGNHLEQKELNLVLHVRDVLPPNPYGIVREFKANTFARFPNLNVVASDTVDDNDWINNYINKTTFPGGFVDTRSQWAANSLGVIANTGGFVLTSLPRVSDNIGALRANTFNPEIVRTVTPGHIIVEDNVEVLLSAGASDNAGQAFASMTYRLFDLTGTEVPRAVGTTNTWNSPGVSSNDVFSTRIDSRAIFRESTDITFPISVPIEISAQDNALTWDNYDNYSHTETSFTWGTLKKGTSAPNSRTFKTTLPVYGSELHIRTIDRGLRPRR